MRFWLTMSPFLLALADSQEICSWCEGGSCEKSCDFAKAHFATSVTTATGRLFPYWVPTASTVQAVDSSSVFPNVEIVALMHHGDGRNGYDYLCSMFNSVKAEFGHDFATERAVVFAPQLYYPEDSPADNELFWDRGLTESSAWSWGFNSSSSLGATISSFEALDEMLLAATNRTRFPSLRRLVVAGHSSGGQTIQRYALANRVDEVIKGRGVDVHYFPANPSSWTYLSAKRPVLRETVSCDSLCNNETIAKTAYSFADAPSGGGVGCSSYNTYGYGLDNVTVPYFLSVGVQAMVDRYPSRHVTYLAGASDICNQPEQDSMSCLACSVHDGGLETTCDDYAQGWCRFERAHAFAQHVRAHYNDDSVHEILDVPGVGHNGCAMVQSTVARAKMFGGEGFRERMV